MKEIDNEYLAEVEIEQNNTFVKKSKDSELLSISMPRSLFSEEGIDNLNNLISSKGELMKRAFDVEKLPVEIEGDKITFPWFKDVCFEHTNAYMQFIQAICNMVNNQNRVSTKAKEIVNEKYEFRCFLLRLGFIGEQYKPERKILLSKLSGSASFKVGKRKVGL